MKRYFVRMRFTSEGVANLRTRNESTLRGAVEALIKSGSGRLGACHVHRLDDISALIELPDSIAAIAMVEAARAEGFLRVALIPLSPDDPDADSAPIEPTDDHRS